MNNSNPFVPQGSILEQSKRRSRMKLGVFCVLAIGVASLTAMLIQGCKRDTGTADNSTPADTNADMTVTADTNTQPIEASNPPVAMPVVATPPVVMQPPVEASGSEYTVVKGDSFSKIAKTHGVSIRAIVAANPGVDSAKLKIGQKLSIPAATSAQATEGSTGTDGEIYVVKSGDTLTKIAKANGTTVKAIESENNLSTTKIKVGQKLKIPAKAEAAVPVAAPAPAEVPVTPAPAATNLPNGQ